MSTHLATVTSSQNHSMEVNSTGLITGQPTRQATLIGAILAFVFIFLGLIGNFLLITAILSVKKLRSNIINIFIVSVKFQENQKTNQIDLILASIQRSFKYWFQSIFCRTFVRE